MFGSLLLCDSDFREKSVYCYENISNGNIQWDYPMRADDEMDISTTPPHITETPELGKETSLQTFDFFC